MIMVTTDGTDECGPSDQSCGINAPNLASLLLNHFNTQEAMSMDQGNDHQDQSSLLLLSL